MKFFLVCFVLSSAVVWAQEVPSPEPTVRIEEVAENPPVSKTEETSPEPETSIDDLFLEDSSKESENSWLGTLCSLGCVLLPAWMLFRLIRKKNAGDPSAQPHDETSSSLMPLRTRLTDDGFWIRGKLPPHAPVAWSCVARGDKKQGTLRYAAGPEGVFVFTGSRPRRVRAWLEAPVEKKGPPPLRGRG
ncbi:MAG: hypothetical protein QM627_02290 [Luteolibacter sp.]